MLDRASSFAREDVVAMLRTDFVPVALDVWYEERRQDTVGEWYRALVAQREGMRPGRTTQGFYIARPDGELLRGWNNRDPAKLARFLRQSRETGDGVEVAASDDGADPRFSRSPPDGGAVVDVFARIVEADWPEAKRGWADAAMRSATARDHLWITAAEIEALARAELPRTLARRIARFHLIDNTRGEPPMWRPDEVRECALRAEPGADGVTITGTVGLATAAGERSCDAVLRGEVTIEGGHLERFDLVARCAYRGEGRFTPGAPPGTFTLVVATRVAEGAPADAVPPQGARDLDGYLQAR